MAYLRDIAYECRRTGCTKKSTKELVNRWNGTLGQYCAVHAKQALKIQEQYEKGIN